MKLTRIYVYGCIVGSLLHKGRFMCNIYIYIYITASGPPSGEEDRGQWGEGSRERPRGMKRERKYWLNMILFPKYGKGPTAYKATGEIRPV